MSPLQGEGYFWLKKQGRGIIIKVLMRAILILFLLACGGCAGAGERELTFRGTADVSAAVFVDPNHFAVANDESNLLRIYRVGQTDKPLTALDLNDFLKVDSQFPEADIEAAARVDDTIYWITSHGRNKDGKLRPSRYRFFAVQIQPKSSETETGGLVPLGRPCGTLIRQFLTYPEAAKLNLDRAVQFHSDLPKKDREKLAPKRNGLNIEAMTWLPEQKSLLIGLRNPLFKPDKKTPAQAIAFELLNPEEVIEGGPAQFGRILLWDLGNRGLRGMEYDPFRKVHTILAGPIDSETTCALFAWDGDFDHKPALVFEWPRTDPPFTPEGIALHPSGQTLWIFSDDGTLEIPVSSPYECRDGELLKNGKCHNKFLTDDLRKTFRVRVYEQPIELPQL